MPNFVDDTVTLTLGGEDVVIAESYDIRTSFLTQPSTFSIRLGWGSVTKQLIDKYPPRTPFELRINNALQFSGNTDGYEAAENGGATELTIRGRDALADLHDAYVTAEVSYKNATYKDVVQGQLDAVGFTGTLFFTNEANRKVQAGVNVQQLGAPVDAATEQTEATGVSGVVRKAIQAKVGERRYDFLKRILDRAGLFLWAAADGSLMLSEPNAKQSPTYRLSRQRGQPVNLVNVLSARYRNETTHRYSEAVIYGRGGGRVFGRQKSKGKFTDDEMVSLGYQRPLVHRDVNVTSDKQAEFYARRVLAETRRAGWQLTYTLAGHSIPSLVGGRAVWTVDTVVDVADDEFGITGPYWIEAVNHRRSPHTTTEIVLMRPDDLVFATGESE